MVPGVAPWIQLATGLAYLAVALLVAGRKVPDRLLGAKTAFVWWWTTLAIITVVVTVPAFLHGGIGQDQALLAALGVLTLATGGSAAIAYYQSVLLGIFRRPGHAIIGYYGMLFLGLMAMVLIAVPSYSPGEGFVYRDTWVSPGGFLHPALTITFFWLLLGPGLVGTGLQLWATDRLGDARVRERSYAVAAALFVWYLFVLVGSISVLSGAVPEWLLELARIVNLAAACFAFVALLGALRNERTTGPLVDDLAGPPIQPGPKRVLVVDDEEPILDTLTLALENFCKSGPQVVRASCGEDALPLIEAQSFDLIVSDYRMKGLTGADVLEHAWAHQPTAVRVLLTGYAEDAVVADAVERGHVHAYALKPWDMDSFVADVDHWLIEGEKSEARKEDLLQFLARSRALV